MIKPFVSVQFLKFLATGGVAALANFGSRMLYSQWLDFSWAVVLSYLTGMLLAFVLARLLVFTDTSQPIHRSFALFALVNMLAIAQTWIISVWLAFHVLPALGIKEYSLELAHAVGILVPAFTSYIGHKKFSFR